ncbi:hypothetical protein B0H17DRAFT_1133334 [Mycena rosella]|uniref:Uncharacterized protein n=1 Tax=Mycena rosella TaxID=1033263 RepID=A0AAD7DL51_MYCRO|nr:hypothetical protein B0H17DRAFT_1133334 [Mycena rosella]
MCRGIKMLEVAYGICRRTPHLAKRREGRNVTQTREVIPQGRCRVIGHGQIHVLGCPSRARNCHPERNGSGDYSTYVVEDVPKRREFGHIDVDRQSIHYAEASRALTPCRCEEPETAYAIKSQWRGGRCSEVVVTVVIAHKRFRGTVMAFHRGAQTLSELHILRGTVMAFHHGTQILSEPRILCVVFSLLALEDFMALVHVNKPARKAGRKAFNARVVRLLGRVLTCGPTLGEMEARAASFMQVVYATDAGVVGSISLAALSVADCEEGWIRPNNINVLVKVEHLRVWLAFLRTTFSMEG